MVDSDDFIDDSDDPELYDAIMASLLQPGMENVKIDDKALADDRRLLKEVMQLSRLEE